MVEDFAKVIPSIIEITTFESSENNSFQLFNKNKIIPNLAWLGKDLLKELFQLFKIGNSFSMQNLILRIMFKCFNQRKNLIKRMKKTIVITNHKDSDLLNWAKFNLAILFEIFEQSEVWIKSKENQKNHKFNQQKFENCLTILEYFDVILIKNSFVEDDKPVLLEFSEKISKFRQNMLISLDLHTKIINLIKSSIYNLSEIYETKSLKKKKLKKLFFMLFKILKNLVINNKQSQHIFIKYLDVFIRDLKMSLGQTELITEIFRNNNELCSTITEETLQNFIFLIENEGRQARFLDLFPVIQIVNEKPILASQILVFKVLTQSENFKYLLYMDENGHFLYEKNDKSLNPNYLDQPVLYHKKLCETLTSCAYGKTEIFAIEAKCQKLFSLNCLITAISLANKNSQTFELKIPLLRLFYEIYVKTQKFSKEMFRNQEFVEFIIENTGKKETQDFVELFLQILLKYSRKYIMKKRLFYETFEDFEAVKNYLSQIHQNGIEYEKTSKIQTLIEKLEKIGYSINIL